MARTTSATSWIDHALLLCMLLGCRNAAGAAQSAEWQERLKGFIPEAVVEHMGTNAVVTANDPRPLLQAMTAVSKEYGWFIDYEDPPYANSSELIDSTAPEWRSSRPNEPGVVSVAGGLFRSGYQEASNMQLPESQEATLQKLITDYNASGNPGKFALVKEAEGRYLVIGRSIKGNQGQNEGVKSLLDQPISIPIAIRPGSATVDLIVKELARATGAKCGVLYFGPLVFQRAAIGGQSVAARNLLLQVFASFRPGRELVYQWLFDPQRKEYYLNVFAAMRSIRDNNGVTRSIFVAEPAHIKVPSR